MALFPIPNENDLLHRISMGHEDALAELFHGYHQQLGAFINTLTHDKEMTKEIVQDIFVKIWMERHSLPKIENLSSYLFILTKNYTLNCIRKKVSQRRREIDYLKGSEELFTAEDPFDLQEPDYLDLIERAVAQLPPQQQRVFSLRRQGLKNPEIARQLAISIDSVKKYQQLALRSVSEFVKAHTAVSIVLLMLL